MKEVEPPETYNEKKRRIMSTVSKMTPANGLKASKSGFLNKLILPTKSPF